MQLSENGLGFIKREEGFAPHPALDTDKQSWGYGHNRVGNEPVPLSITLADAEALLTKDLAPHELAVNHLAPWANQNQFDALVDFSFNAGDHALAQLLSHGRPYVITQLPLWCHSTRNGVTAVDPVLQRRRELEVALYGA